MAGIVLIAAATASCADRGGSPSILSDTVPAPTSSSYPDPTDSAAVVPSTLQYEPPDLDEPADLYVAPVPIGTGDGTSAADAAGLAELDRLIKSAPPGSVIELAADDGPYQITEPITITSGGAPDSPITIRGPISGNLPVLSGDRSDPYAPDGAPGPVMFRLTEGADHLVFARVHCERAGNGCFHVVGRITDLTIHAVTARNVRRFFENGTSKAGRDATIEGLTISQVDVAGFSKGAIRIGHDTHDVLIVDVDGDSEHQDGDNFAMGIHLVDTAHDIHLERISMSNALDTLHPYWNGDGFTAEEGVSDLRLVDTQASGNSDAGYDLKSSSTVLENVSAEANKHNFRFWGRRMTMIGCTGLDPALPGGTGSQSQVQVLKAATVSIRSCRFSDDDPETVVFSVEDTSSLEISDLVVEHSSTGELTVIAPGAELDQQDIEVFTR